MRRIIFLGLIVLCCSTLWAADRIQFNVKPGLWESTTTTTMTGMPPIPADALANLPPEQRARVEASMQSMGGGGKPHVHTSRSCETKEKLEKDLAFNDQKECTRTFVSSTGSRIDMKIKCVNEGVTSEGTLRIDAISTDSAKGTMDVTSTGSGHSMHITSTFTARWLGSDCGNVK